MTENRKLVAIRKACELADVSRRTIYNWIKEGKVQYVRTASGNIRIYEDSLWGGTRKVRSDRVAGQDTQTVVS